MPWRKKSEDLKSWLPTTLPQSTIHEGFILSKSFPRSLSHISNLCDSIETCVLFCLDTDNFYSLWRIIAEPFLNKSGDDGPTMKCWTRQPRGNFVPRLLPGVTISGSPVISSFPDRVPDNLMDGFLMASFPPLLICMDQELTS